MRKPLLEKVERGRVRVGPWASDTRMGANGAFMLQGPTGATLRIIASDGVHPDAEGWEHVSVSCTSMNRCPNWIEMCFVKDLFWDGEEMVIQIHPRRSQYVNHHPTTLHMWRHPLKLNMPSEPPPHLVGPVK